MSAHHPTIPNAADVMLPSGSLFRKLPAIGAVLGVLGIGASLGMHGEHGANLWAYLIAVVFFL